MTFFQKEITLSPRSRGFHLITSEIKDALQTELLSVQQGIVNLFIKHTSASLTLNENIDPSVRGDMEAYFCDIVSDKPYFEHTYEGKDDIPAHIKSSIFGSSITIPITNTQLNLGTWQGIYLGEHRDFGGSRKIVATLIGE